MIRDIARWIALAGVFVLPFLPLVVANSLFFPFITGKNFLFRIVVEIIFAAWVVLALYEPKYRPRFSYILAGFAALLGVMALADAFGVSPQKSFWSNYERMEGYVTLAHLGLYFVVAGSILHTERLWNAFLNTSVAVAVFMMLYGFCQLSGSDSCPISQSDVRIDGRMGNAAYLAVYMLFHIFMSALLLVRARTYVAQAIYALLSLGFTFILFQTATRGTMAGLAGGVMLSALYVALFERQNRVVRKVAIGAVGVVLVLGGSFYAAKDTPFVQENAALARLASVFNLKELETRFTIWSLAVEGVKERPLLGWGQENFNYVFNQNYNASLYGQEPWFDRVHNLMFDWLIAGGILGFLAYLSVLLSAVYYVAVRPWSHPAEETFSVVERGALLGLLGGYTAHNLFVFDNLISYFFFVSILAMIHVRVSREIPKLMQFRFSDQVLSNIAVPVVGVVLCAVVYMVNVPGLSAAADLIKGFQAQDPAKRLEAFKVALARGGFANQEIREQTVRMSQEFLAQSPNLVKQLRTANPKMTQEQAEKQVTDLRVAYGTLAEEEIRKQVEETPNDVRILVFQASFYRALGKSKEAIPILERARELSPEKQQIYFELGFAYNETGDPAKAKEIFKQAFELDTRFTQARMMYAVGAIYAGDMELLHLLITPEYEAEYFASDAVARALLDRKNFAELERVFAARIEKSPNDVQLRVSLAWIQNSDGRGAAAIKTIEDAIAANPSFKAQGDQYITALKAGQVPQ